MRYPASVNYLICLKSAEAAILLQQGGSIRVHPWAGQVQNILKCRKVINLVNICTGATDPDGCCLLTHSSWLCDASVQYLSSSTRDPLGWCRRSHWTPSPQRSGVGGGWSAEPLWCGSPPSSGGSAAVPLGGLHQGAWSPPWGCWLSLVLVFSLPCWKASKKGRRFELIPLYKRL